MAVDLKLRYLQTNFTAKQIILEDFTGMYDANTNTTGYGRGTADPNLHKDSSDLDSDPSDAVNGWDLVITRPDGTEVTYNSSSLDDLQYDNFNEVIQIAFTDTQDIINGEWTFAYSIDEESGVADTETITQYIYNTDTIDRAINAAFAAQVDFCDYPDCECNTSLVTLWTYYIALKAAIQEQNTTQADYLSAQITSILG